VIIAGAALLALFIAAGMLILASFARTFKEGQSLVSPFMIAFVLPLVFIQSPSQEFTTSVAFIPVVNVAMMFRQAIGGYFEWQPIAITIGMEIFFVTAALKIATSLVEREDFMMDGSGRAFGRLLRRFTRRSGESGRTVAG
jgi:sodium transport system permease protein